MTWEQPNASRCKFDPFSQRYVRHEVWIDDRNAVAYKGVIIHLPRSISIVWALCICQLRAIAKREHQTLATATHDALIYACIEWLERDPRRLPLSSMTSHDMPPVQLTLTSELRTFRDLAHSQHHVNRRSEIKPSYYPS